MSAVAAPPISPYKGLAPFEDSELDALLFFGRERETEVIVANLLASKLTVLYGPSGVGKSSVLRAAVTRRLRDEAPGAQVEVVAEWSSDDVRLPSPDGEAFFILDQFEEYFLYHEGELLDQLPELLEQPLVHVLIALREDQLARLDAFQARIPTMFANRLRLDHLDARSARAAIVGPLDRWNEQVPSDERVTVETALVDAVVEDVQSQPNRIEAPYLQLVLERVWAEELASGSRVLRVQTLHRLGGATAIVSAHLERTLGALPPRDAEIASNALRFLVTPSRTKIAQSFDDLVGYTNESPVALQSVLQALAAQRILRTLPDRDESRYEIFHDVLAEPVLVWRREHDARAAIAAAGRRHRRLAIVAVGSLLLAAGMIVLAVFALAQRSEASKQKRAAQVQAQRAVGQQHEAQREKAKADREALRAQAQSRKATAARKRADANATRAKRNAQEAKANAARARQSEQEAKTSAASAKQNAAAAQAAQSRAQSNAARAERSERAAVSAEASARRNARLARRNARSATVGEYTALAAANLAVDPVKSIRSALSAARLERSNRVEDALRNALGAIEVRGILDGGGGAVESAAFSHDDSLVATGSAGGKVRAFRVRGNGAVWTVKAGAAVAKLAFSPDDKQLAVAAGRDAFVYDAATGKLEQTLAAGGPVLDLAYANGGRVLITGSADRSLRIYDAGSGTLLHTITGSSARQQIAVSPNGLLFAVASPGRAIADVYAAPSGDPVAQPQQPGLVTDLAFSPNGAYLVTTGQRNGFVWDTKTWTQLHILQGHDASIDAVAFAPDGRVVTGSIDSSARVWDPASGASLFTLGAQHRQKVLAVAVSPDGRQIVTASADETARVWNAPLGTAPRILAGHTDSVTGVTFSRDGSLLLTWSDDGTARIWQTQIPTLTTVGLHGGAVRTVAFSPDGTRVLSASADGTAKVWSGTSAEQTLAQGGSVTFAAFAHGGRDIVTAGDDGTAKVWRVSDGGLTAVFPHGAPVAAAALLAGDGVATAGADGTVKAWRAGTTPVWTASQGSPATAAAANAGGTVLATGAADGSVRLWRAADGKSLGVLRGHTGAVTSLAFSRDGSRLVSGSADSTARIWDVGSAKLVSVLDGHRLAVTSVGFSPDGKRVVTASVDGDAIVWTVEGKLVFRLKFHVATVSAVAYSADGRWIMTAGPTAAALWQARTGRLFIYLQGTHGNLTAGAWARDSERIVTGDSGGGVETFRCALCAQQPALVALAKARIAGLR